MSNSYCVRCKAKTPTAGARLVASANGRKMMQGKCTACGSKKSQFVSSSTVAGKRGKKGGNIFRILGSLF